mmetsp:Transcript_31300/g.61450  ORF Transcript_31300/g.61450 Transcript_31300/m.61450 type:complete len:244 (+) Transcript_31300:422-1153(+)
MHDGRRAASLWRSNVGNVWRRSFRQQNLDSVSALLVSICCCARSRNSAHNFAVLSKTWSGHKGTQQSAASENTSKCARGGWLGNCIGHVLGAVVSTQAAKTIPFQQQQKVHHLEEKPHQQQQQQRQLLLSLHNRGCSGPVHHSRKVFLAKRTMQAQLHLRLSSRGFRMPGSCRPRTRRRCSDRRRRLQATISPTLMQSHLVRPCRHKHSCALEWESPHHATAKEYQTPMLAWQPFPLMPHRTD